MYRILALSALTLAAAAPVHAQAGKPDLSDAEVAHVAVTANGIDVDFAKLALDRSRNEAVRGFATTMQTDHTAVNQQAAALATRLGVTPKDNGVSQSLQAGAREARDQMSGLSGVAFDRAYMDREVAYHQAVLDALDTVLIPTTENTELRKLLTDVRPAFVAHLEHARRVRAGLGGTR